MGRHSKKGRIHKVTEYEFISDVLDVNSLTAKMMLKYIDYLNSQCRRRLLPQIELKVLDKQIVPHGLFEGVYKVQYTISILTPDINIGDYRPVSLIGSIKKIQKCENFNFYEAIQPTDENGKVLKDIMPYFQNKNKSKIKSVNTIDLLKVANIIIDNYGYCRKKDLTIEQFNWLRTTGEKAFDILTNEPSNTFNSACIRAIERYDKTINEMLLWNKVCFKSQYKYKELVLNERCFFEDVDKVVALIPIFNHMKNKEIKYFRGK